ncbi:MAG: UbiA family prenyltransferase [Gammaproteobacteria bacterium]
MTKSEHKLPLFVDLDGTLIKSNVGLESVLQLLKQNFLFLFVLPLWALGGLPALKRNIAERVSLPIAKLPFNPELMEYLRSEHGSGRAITLISASDQGLVKQFGEHLGLFDACIGSTGQINLKSERKLAHIRSLAGDKFAYAGNARADLPIWAAATEILAVNCAPGLVDRVPNQSASRRFFDLPGARHLALLRALRPHQWLKNGLLFLPLILSHQLLNGEVLLQAALGVVSFCLCASSVYLANDLLDLEADRSHRSKCKRPLASGELPLEWAFVAAPVLLILAILLALPLGGQFLLVFAVYYVTTCLYSLELKRLFLVDALVLALLYTLRIVAGSAAIGVITTDWLLAFSLSLFLGLALLKRYTELGNLQRDGIEVMPGRAYRAGHRNWLAALGIVAALLAIAVFMVYINASETTVLYSRPLMLWAICPLLLYLLGRIWFCAYRGRLDDDPILFAIEDRQSQLALVFSGLLIWLAI